MNLSQTILPLGSRTWASPFTLRHLAGPYCFRKRARSRTPVPVAMVSTLTISLTISKSIPTTLQILRETSVAHIMLSTGGRFLYLRFIIQ